ncbi:MAG: hypothetical protein ACRCZF_10905, partial [Gemmataceae bacterium]
MTGKEVQQLAKKHHFWILAGLVPLMVLLAFIFMTSGVSTAITKEATVIKTSLTQAKSTRPPGKGVIDDLAAQKEVLAAKKGEHWKANWDYQKKFFDWPKAPAGQFNKYFALKFGDQLKETSNEFEVFTRPSVYQAAYEEFPDKIAPTSYAGGWQNVLRWVNPWGQVTPRSEQIWLALEDLWLQRAMVDPIRIVNENVARFTEVKAESPSKFQKKFRSRVWEVTMTLEEKNNQRILKGKLKNRTPQLQLLGMGNTMRLNVWVDDTPEAQPIPFTIEGEFIPGELEVEIPFNPTHQILPGITPKEIVKIEQVLDIRTVPIRRLDRLVLGYRSAKHATQEMKGPSFWTEPDPMAAPAGGNPNAPETGGSGGQRGSTPMGDPRGGPGGGAGAAAAGPGVQTGPPGAVLDGNRKRYLELTEQVRRMPVGIVVVVDQSYVPDVLVAYANSSFRFQVVQHHFRRFRGSLESPTAPGASGSSGSSMPSGYPSGGPGAGGDSLGGISGNVGESLGGRGGSLPPSAGMGPGSGASGGGNISEAQANSGL